MYSRVLTLVVAVLLGVSFLPAACLAGEASGASPKADSEVVKFPAVSEAGAMSVEEAFAKRRSVRRYDGASLTPEQLGQLLWSAQGISDPGRGLRTAPSAGALYPLELYVVTEDGVFKYLPKDHAMRRVKSGDYRQALARAAVNQTWIAKAPVSVVIAAAYARTTGKYGRRASRYVDVEAGCAAENLFLQATALGLGSCCVGAFDDAGVARVIKCERSERALLICPVGKAAQAE